MGTMIPEEELLKQRTLNLAPMVDFLFLILAVFAVLAVTRTALYDSEVNLVTMDTQTPLPSMAGSQPGVTILLSINQDGQYKWITEFNEYLIDGVDGIKKELVRQQEQGLLPLENEKIKVLLHIDKEAQWESVAKVIFAIKEAGFQISPVYCPD